MTNEHEEMVALIPLLINETIDQNDKYKLDAHLKECATCKREYEFELQLQGKLDKWPLKHTSVEEAQARAFANFQPHLKPEKRERVSIPERVGEFLSSLIPSGPVLAGAFGAVCAITVGVLLFQPDEEVIWRGCESVIADHQLTVTSANGESVNALISTIIEDNLPTAHYQISPADNPTVKVKINSDVCDLPSLILELEKSDQIQSAAINK